jgi:NADP-dependent 3-hydroxy acid dehydrogenase YdfG
VNTTPSTLAGRTALITGSTSGLGTGIAVALADLAAAATEAVGGRLAILVNNVAALVQPAAGPHAGNIHGTILTVDGGATAS